jgi:hypothetical protein
MRKLLILFISAFVLINMPVNYAACASTLSDTVLISNSSNDSLNFTLYTSNHCCCTHFFNKKISIFDSTINLYAEYDDKNCDTCDCMLDGANTNFSCEEIKSGKYQVNFSEDLYCPPGHICPAIAIHVANKHVGSITVVNEQVSDLVEQAKPKTKSSHSILTYSGAEKKLILKITKPQIVYVTAYIVNGEKSTQLSSKRFLEAGTHTFRMDQERFNSGVVVIHVKGENFSEVQMVNLTK